MCLELKKLLKLRFALKIRSKNRALSSPSLNMQFWVTCVISSVPGSTTTWWRVPLDVCRCHKCISCLIYGGRPVISAGAHRRRRRQTLPCCFCRIGQQSTRIDVLPEEEKLNGWTTRKKMECLAPYFLANYVLCRWPSTDSWRRMLQREGEQGTDTTC